MIQDVPYETEDAPPKSHYRIQAINNILLGKDESIFIAKDTASNVVNPLDPNFTRIRDPSMLDLVVDVAPFESESHQRNPSEDLVDGNQTAPNAMPKIIIDTSLAQNVELASSMKLAFSSLLQQVTNLITIPTPPPKPKSQSPPRE